MTSNAIINESSARSVQPRELKVGAEYFLLLFLDEERCTPDLRTLVFAGPNPDGRFSFQDPISYYANAGLEDGEASWPGQLFVLTDSQLHDVFAFDELLRALLQCQERRATQPTPPES